jgi:hypothetical protein
MELLRFNNGVLAGMTTATNNTVVDHSTDAGYRAWVAEIISSCSAVGLVRTSDTGQINTASATRPGVNTATAYACFRFNDTMQATAPIMLKFFFGTGAATDRPQIRIQVGTAFDGSGGLSGLGSANAADILSLALTPSTAISYISYYCAVPGAFAFAWKVGSNINFFFAMVRSVDNDQTPNANAAAQIYSTSNGTSLLRSISYVNGLIYGNNGSSSAGVPNAQWLPCYAGLFNDTRVGGVPQVFKAVMATTPRVRPQLFVCGCLMSETGQGVQNTATLVGSTPRNYMCVGSFFGGSSGATGPGGSMMIWE